MTSEAQDPNKPRPRKLLNIEIHETDNHVNVIKILLNQAFIDGLIANGTFSISYPHKPFDFIFEYLIEEQKDDSQS